ncbi:bacteriohemerythrin [Candidatus Parabeggiatoa sp. HSG14]|uniref:bacteriohemerythrin n=1 Tax=Candidatus Parabeggiatoa sp. HSG14 TaxID=3055593 RepID=UPI0025A9237A|nr:bacteriohemerythrin [Thiotrichales bacterium HSG14]
MLKNIKISTKLGLMLAIPIIGLIFFTVNITLEKLNIVNNLSVLHELSNFAVKSSSLVHELQKERGLSAGFLGSKGKQFSTELQTQQTKTDNAVKELNLFLVNFDIKRFGNEIQNNLAEIIVALNRIEAKRNLINSLDPLAENEFEYYTLVIDLLLADINHLSKIITHAELSNQIVAYVNLLQAKEKAGVERATLNNVLSKELFSPGIYKKFGLLIGTQDIFIKNFFFFATSRQKKFYRDTMQSQSIDEVKKIRKLFLKQSIKLQTLANIRAYLGYSGLIYQLNNYILWGEQQYIDTFYQQYKSASTILEIYKSLPYISRSDIEYVEIIENTFVTYKKYLAMAITLKNQQKSEDEINAIIQIDDAPAIKALNHLLAGSHLNIESAYWWQVATKRINLFKVLEDRISSDLKMSAQALKKDAQSIFTFYLIVTGGIVLFTFFYAREIFKETNQAYARFVPDEFLTLLNKGDVTDIQLSNCMEMNMTVLFSDIRSFTTISEKMSPQENFDFINAYLGEMGPIIRQHHGFVDKYIGDAIMALFINADDAINAAIAMVRIQRYQGLETGIGINTGQLMLGIIGEKDRLQCTVISDAVNLASRLESTTKVYKVPLLISQNTFDNLIEPSQHAIRFIDKIKVKGRSEQVGIFEVFESDSKTIRESKLLTRKTFEEAVRLFHICQFDEVNKLMQTCLHKVPNDTIAKLYLQRCQNFLKINQSNNWEETAKAVEWTPKLSVDNQIIDEQHQELFLKMKNLIMSIGNNKAEDEIGEIIYFLKSYVIIHFEMEERYMKQYDYPQYSVHKAKHVQFIENLENIKKYYMKNGSSLYLTLRIQDEIVEWFIHHIGKMDKKLGQFLNQLNIEA